MRRLLGAGRIYIGFAGFAEDGVTRVNAAGADTYSGQHYSAASNKNPTNQYVSYTGYSTGHAAPGTSGESPTPLDPGVLHEDVRFVSIIIYANYQNESGTTFLDTATVEPVPGALAGLDRVTTLSVLENAISTPEFAQVVPPDFTRTGPSGALKILTLSFRKELDESKVLVRVNVSLTRSAGGTARINIKGSNFDVLHSVFMGEAETEWSIDFMDERVGQSYIYFVEIQAITGTISFTASPTNRESQLMLTELKR